MDGCARVQSGLRYSCRFVPVHSRRSYASKLCIVRAPRGIDEEVQSLQCHTMCPILAVLSSELDQHRHRAPAKSVAATCQPVRPVSPILGDYSALDPGAVLHLVLLEARRVTCSGRHLLHGEGRTIIARAPTANSSHQPRSHVRPHSSVKLERGGDRPRARGESRHQVVVCTPAMPADCCRHRGCWHGWGRRPGGRISATSLFTISPTTMMSNPSRLDNQYHQCSLGRTTSRCCWARRTRRCRLERESWHISNRAHPGSYLTA